MEESHRKGKLEASRSGPEVFQREGKAGGIPLLKHDCCRAGRELGGWRGSSVREGKLRIHWLTSRVCPLLFFHGFKNSISDSEEVNIMLRM